MVPPFNIFHMAMENPPFFSWQLMSEAKSRRNIVSGGVLKPCETCRGPVPRETEQPLKKNGFAELAVVNGCERYHSELIRINVW